MGGQAGRGRRKMQKDGDGDGDEVTQTDGQTAYQLVQYVPCTCLSNTASRSVSATNFLKNALIGLSHVTTLQHHTRRMVLYCIVLYCQNARREGGGLKGLGKEDLRWHAFILAFSYLNTAGTDPYSLSCAFLQPNKKNLPWGRGEVTH